MGEVVLANLMFAPAPGAPSLKAGSCIDSGDDDWAVLNPEKLDDLDVATAITKRDDWPIGV